MISRRAQDDAVAKWEEAVRLVADYNSPGRLKEYLRWWEEKGSERCSYCYEFRRPKIGCGTCPLHVQGELEGPCHPAWNAISNAFGDEDPNAAFIFEQGVVEILSLIKEQEVLVDVTSMEVPQ